MKKNKLSLSPAIRRWRLFAVFWPVICLVFAGAILICPSGRTVDQRIGDVGITLISLIFFAIGMSARRKLLTAQENATARTTALVVSEGRRHRTGKSDSYFPEFEFQAGDAVCHVSSTAGSGFHHLTNGSRVTLYYDPRNPDTFYVPQLYKNERRVSLLLCGIGVLFPLAGLLAPWLRTLVAALS